MAELEFEIRFGGDPEDVLETAWGIATPAGLLAANAALLADERFRPGLRILVDHTNLDWSAMSGADMRVRAEQLRRLNGPLAGGRVATVTRGTVDFGLQRMSDGLVDGDLTFARRVFSTFEDARAWLREAPGP